VNFLAHSLFGQGNSERVAGQFAGDFVRGNDLSQFSAGLQLGIRMHRFIDAFTDHHPSAVAVRTVFQPPVRRFAGIVTDVVFDHYLARDWERYANTPLLEHIDDVHSALAEHHAQLPHGLQRFAQYLKTERVLEANLSFDGVALTLERISRRSARFSPLALAADVAQEHESDLYEVFVEIFPQLLVAADEHRLLLLSKASES